MGRELKRVVPNFSWPLDKVWSGYQTPKELLPSQCECCNGTGYNPQTKELQDAYYDSNNFGVTWQYEYYVDPEGNPAKHPPWKILGNTKRWCHNITQDEVQALVDSNRLIDFTHTFNTGDDGKERGWVKREDNYIPSAEEVNKWSQTGMGHDGINAHVLLKCRANRLGIYGLCGVCDGDGQIFKSPEQKIAYEKWEPSELPSGDWWQVWETVSEGSPITPAFATAEELIDYLVQYGDKWDQKRNDGGWSLESAQNFVKQAGWVPSMILKDGNIYTAKNMITDI